MESDHAKYLGKCKVFREGCKWLIRLTLRKRKDLWEVRKADVSVPIKVLRTATESSYGFMPSYRKTWKAK
ncbi:hypothetical protein PIB30_049804 [Stylosanthes scabra]|uniref:Transposase MuDR plant domain-containing protein n=1 Tax=Stylosanthes scabra TaxID=79078 RepID=A0ABU6SI47_9FABA|nr:hypothetical protein [Stylosanthes scabra]